MSWSFRGLMITNGTFDYLLWLGGDFKLFIMLDIFMKLLYNEVWLEPDVYFSCFYIILYYLRKE